MIERDKRDEEEGGKKEREGENPRDLREMREKKWEKE